MRQAALALRIETDGTMGPLALPSGTEARRTAVRNAVGGPTLTRRLPRVMGPIADDRRPRVVMLHVHDNGEGEGLPFNPAAWALLSGWLGEQVPVGLFGRVIITTYERDGRIEPLPIDLLDEAGRARQVVQNVLAAQACHAQDVDEVQAALVKAVRRALTAPLN